MHRPLDRRSLLRALFMTGGGIAASSWLAACGDDSTPSPEAPGPGPGPAPDPGPVSPDGRELSLPSGPLAGIGALQESGVDGILIPAGFSVRAVARHLTNPVSGAFDPLGLTGYNWHEAPDGGACYPAPDGGWVYVSNSENSSRGGVGALRFSAEGEITDAYRILDGTRRNCAGGASPWGTWLSCEETGDGFVYECNPLGTPDDARVLPALGLFNHEAAAVDIATRTVFLTEDSGSGRLYRFVADENDLDSSGDSPRLRMESGRLQALNIAGYENGGYAEDDAVWRTLHRVTWADVVGRDRPQSEVRSELGNSGEPVPGTVFRGGEGMWLYEMPAALRSVPPGGTVPTRMVLFFASKGDNRIYAYDIDNALIESVFDNDSIEPDFNDVDNLVVSPAGDVLVAEDGDAMRLAVVIPNAPAKVLLQITLGGSEITGPAFSPDGSRLYFSSQRGPNLAFGRTGSGVTYELTIPEQYRAAV